MDEFQDTNTAQYRFVEALRERLAAAPGGAEPRLFTVGDPKQSIYRFRGAEVDLFEEHVARAAKDSRASLSVCWRSAPELTRAIGQSSRQGCPSRSSAASTAGPNAIL